METKERLTYFLDLDGTLLDKRNSQIISYKNIETIRFLQQYANVVISTGRNYTDPKVQAIIKLLNIKDVIASSGAEIYIDGTLVKKYSIDEKTIRQIRIFASAAKISFVSFHNQGDSFYSSNPFFLALARRFAKKKFFEIKHHNDYEENEEVWKISFVISKLFTAKALLKKMKLFFDDKLNLNLASNNFVLEITNIKADKGLAASTYCKFKGINLKNTIHIGDSMSDLSTKGYVGKLIAMGNSSKELKNNADYVGPKFSKAGIAKIIQWSLNIPFKKEFKQDKKDLKKIKSTL